MVLAKAGEGACVICMICMVSQIEVLTLKNVTLEETMSVFICTS